MSFTLDDIIVLAALVFVVVVFFRLYVLMVRGYGVAVAQQRPAEVERGAAPPPAVAPAGTTDAALLSPTATREEVEAYARQLRSSNANRRAAERQRTDHFEGEDHECSVCLCEAEAAVEFLPCGHTFCGKCAQQLWQHGGVIRRMVCPLDRADVEAIIPEFKMREAFAARARQRGEAPTLSVAEVRRLDAELGRYNSNNTQRTVRGVVQLAARSFTLARFMPFLIQLKVLCLFVGPLLYTLSPVDIIPEVVFGVAGYIDDIVIIMVAMIALAGIARRALGMRD